MLAEFPRVVAREGATAGGAGGAVSAWARSASRWLLRWPLLGEPRLVPRAGSARRSCDGALAAPVLAGGGGGGCIAGGASGGRKLPAGVACDAGTLGAGGTLGRWMAAESRGAALGGAVGRLLSGAATSGGCRAVAVDQVARRAAAE